MVELSLNQRQHVLDVVASIVNKRPIPEACLDDVHVMHRFFFLSQDLPDVAVDLLRLVPTSRWSQWTQHDILTEERMLSLHIAVQLSDYDLVDWLRGLNFGEVQFFHQQGTDQLVRGIDQMVFKSRYNPQLIDGVYIKEIPKYFDSLSKLLAHVLDGRITYKQYRNVLAQIPWTHDALMTAVSDLMDRHQALGIITSSAQVLPFRVLCALFDFLEDNHSYMLRIATVVDQLIQSSTIRKTMALVNLMPYPVLRFLIGRYIDQSHAGVCTHLNDALPNFEYGAIRKIVRRDGLALNYSYD